MFSMWRFCFAGKLYTSDDFVWLEWFVPCELLLTDVDLCSLVCLGLLVCNGLNAVGDVIESSVPSKFFIGS